MVSHREGRWIQDAVPRIPSPATPPARWQPGQQLVYHGRVPVVVKDGGPEYKPCGQEWVEVVFPDGTELVVMHDEVGPVPAGWAPRQTMPPAPAPCHERPPSAPGPKLRKREWPCDLCPHVARGPQGLGAHKWQEHGIPGARARRLMEVFQQVREEIESVLRRYGATGFAYASEGLRAQIAFQYQGKTYRHRMRIPPERDFETYERPAGSGYLARRTPAQARAAWEAEERRLWRCLVLLVKSKLEAVASEITTIEEEFLAWTVTPSGETVGEMLLPQLDRALQEGKLPALMPGLEDR